MAYQILRDLCTACGDCQQACPNQSISPWKGVYRIDAATCTECDGEGEPGMPQCLDACMEEDCIVPA
ncbi:MULTISPECIES: 4Fe-4S binding protein [Marichromatium]|uniref:4Fe-4S binding protein n=1 Tax=Marichromatium gracile TaxID=1048 RepID=A0A4R4A6W9_MARGR|nr:MULTISPECIES: 4Fe-4S binding protein [Marichromatium]MBO8085679.1 4Fe-4S binding protein [Marichromatium sp.]KXX64438.1 ferredoxin [Marichromatium gracile]MBK1710387.1 ferredoxin [Marichromatium gracile]RNE92795.1 ferredoxin [Marichromatium sp. AB32]TCW34557.1 4Fe-4S binding protein [Marichromatium gracile]